METRDDPGLGLGRGEGIRDDIGVARADRHHDIVLTTRRQPAPPSTGTAAKPSSSPRPLLLALVGAVLLAVLITAVVWWATRGDDGATTSPAGATAGQRPAPDVLTVSVGPPVGVVAGEKAMVVVTWSDGAGTFSGSTEDWGDGVGTSSLVRDRCSPTGSPARPASGSYRATHTWAEPGTYPVAISVTTYSCVDGTAVQEQASTTVKVAVAAG